MRIFILIRNFIIPLIMIYIGILYKYKKHKNINKILDLFVPFAMIVSGINNKNKLSINKNALASVNRKCSLIWSISGLFTLLLTIIIIILNKASIINTFVISDIENVSIILLEIELAIFVATFISVEYIIKRNFYKEINKNS